MARDLFDASTLIALAKVGELDLLARLVRRVHVTPQVAEELLERDDHAAVLLEAFLKGGPCVVLADHGKDADAGSLGLGDGESSVLAAYREGDRLILDDRGARTLARSRGIPHTGLLGLLVGGIEAGRLSPEEGLRVLSKLLESDFRLTADLYAWALAHMRGSRA